MRILETITQPEFANLPHGAIVLVLADGKVFTGSQSMMYRFLKEPKQLCHHGKVHDPAHNLAKTRTATVPNDVWCWDITCIRLVAKGSTFYLYMIMDTNPVIEPLFKTLMVTPRFPSGGFKRVDPCRQWTQQPVQLCNFYHRH